MSILGNTQDQPNEQSIALIKGDGGLGQSHVMVSGRELNKLAQVYEASIGAKHKLETRHHDAQNICLICTETNVCQRRHWKPLSGEIK